MKPSRQFIGSSIEKTLYVAVEIILRLGALRIQHQDLDR
jgi:hypothetical protein